MQCAGALRNVHVSVAGFGKTSVREDAIMRKRFVAALSAAIFAGPLIGLFLRGPGISAEAAEAPVGFKNDVLPIFRADCGTAANC
jgi:hypothetical protein